MAMEERSLVEASTFQCPISRSLPQLTLQLITVCPAAWPRFSRRTVLSTAL